MSIVVTMLFSDSSESDLLWVKLNVEKHVVSKWIIVEGVYSHKGIYKGSCLPEVIQEKRFDEFRERIEVVSCKENLLDKIRKTETGGLRQSLEVAIKKLRWGGG